MRSIDADELQIKIASLSRLARSDAQKSLMGRVLYIIDQMPTVSLPTGCRYADANGVCDKFTESEEIVYCTGRPCLYYTPVEYAPIVRCGNCKHFVLEEDVGEDGWEGKCLYNNSYVDTSDFCSCGMERSDGK